MQKDITVSLLIDEIHLKPNFDYKGGNGLANNTSEVATSAFAFMLSSVLSNYKDVIHIMPTKCLKAENLFNIIKRLIIGLVWFYGISTFVGYLTPNPFLCK